MNCQDKFLQLLVLGLGIHCEASASQVKSEKRKVNSGQRKTASEVVLSDAEWRECFALAREQVVAGVMIAAIERLQKERRPPVKLLLEWIGVAEMVRAQNRRVDCVLTELVKELSAHDIEPIVVKGQVVGREWSEPGLRHPGDIDAFVSKEQWSRLTEWLRRGGYRVSTTAAEKHIEINYKGVTVELHHHLNTFASSKANEYWRSNVEREATERSRTVTIGETEVRTLNVDDALVHLVVHAHHHLLTEGIGLKQIVDITMFLYNHFDELKLSVVKERLAGVGLENMFGAVCALMNKYLAMPVEKLPFELDLQDYVYADRIMKEAWRGGNLGHKNNLKGVKPGLLHSMNTALLVAKHSLMFYRLAPAEARGYWWRKVVWRAKRTPKVNNEK